MQIEELIKDEQITIAADRFVLRPVRKSDVGLIGMYAGDKRVAENTRSIPHPLPPGTAEAFVERAMADDRIEDIWIMDGSEYKLGEVMGLIGLEHMDEDERTGGQSQIGYWVAPAFWNTGVATDALAALLSANPHQSKTIFAEVFQGNEASGRVLTNAGFEYVGDAEAHCVARNANVPTWTYVKKMT